MNIVFVVDSPFPFGSANSMRSRSIYKLLELAGYNVHVIADFDTVCTTDVCIEYSYETIYDNNMTFFRRRFVSSKSVRALKKYCRNHNIKCVLMNAHHERLNKIASFCKKEKIKLIVENCEWYDSSSFKLDKFDPRFYFNEKMMSYDIKRVDGVVSISRFLDAHNKKLEIPSVIIPTILDVESTPYSINTNNKKTTIVYTGSIERSKELLKPIINTLSKNLIFRKKIEFHIYGPSVDDVLYNIGGNKRLLDEVGDCVCIHGRIPQNEVQEVLTKADYLIFLRPDRRSSHAGFPTKLGESFAVGTPIIANDTGDLSLYIKSGKNGFLLKSYDDNEIKSVFEKIILLNEEEYRNLRSNARKTAEESFDYRKYVEEINLLFDSNNSDTSKLTGA